MIVPRPIYAISAALWLALAAASARAQTAAQWSAQQQAAAAKVDTIMTDVGAHKGLLDQYVTMKHAYAADNSPAFRLLFGQYVSWYQSFLGAYPEAARSFSIAQPPQRDDHSFPLENGYAARKAVDVIPLLAKRYRVVMFNEAHHIAQTRTLTVRLLSRLRQEGFNYFAAETLVQSDTNLTARGYPTADSGFYTEEPIYADMVRKALKLGYKVVAYEAASNTAAGDAREAEQAENIYRQVFAHDPNARLVVNAGYEHIITSGIYLGGASMAEHLQKLIGTSVLSIDQTVMYPHPTTSSDHPYYSAIVKALQPDDAIVFINAAGDTWSLRPGYDLSVMFPPEHAIDGRPSWLTLGDLRKPYAISGESCHGRYPCLIEARYQNESVDAIPADRLLLDLEPLSVSDSNIALYSSQQTIPSGNLYLQPGSYRITFTVKGERVVHQQDIVVNESSKGP